ncbi:MAG: hypothetical protein COT71_00710 [Candidatus Andersenbacteria bacterium CG10_big_fil_rev_8_21_14_0_10_54_11]|uniref:Undecaprenyl-diphosphatase n=1 Tax=Candidatus Andersenbacteria bacterium CG10_big_fil_rev_8_21_14_0_10_54_11 TaxID=1974485 RepID=A0A2M6X060_9BACT|nr:MAG: hypothetical protein COT71_00710 [Candidatus Andersenbacteria bacterium CG10_big_fil_rev_8_21_14_0_10_54_11]
MTWAEIIGLGAIQGLTEFLPVSSSGHLLAVRLLLGWDDTDGAALDAFLHLGTLLAVLVYYRRVWWGLATEVWRMDAVGRDRRELAAKLALATVPAAVMGYFFENAVEGYFRSPHWLAFMFAVTAAVLYVFDRNRDRRAQRIAADETQIAERADFRDAMIIGLAQAAALLPGVSRSGITIAAGRARGLSRTAAANFSFLLSAPIIAGAGLHQLPALLGGHDFPIAWLLLGWGTSFVLGLAAISGLLKLVEKVSFTPFVVYLVGLAMVLLAAT